ncbi:TMCO4, partial [Symbiodinium necroappetens]
MTVAWPVWIVSSMANLDNAWLVGVERARIGGKCLAQVLADRQTVGQRPVTLIGHSMGARLLVYCLCELYHMGEFHAVDDVVLLGAPVTTEARKWQKVRAVASGRVVNGYLGKDWVLAFLYRYLEWGLSVAGLSQVQVPGVENVNLDGLGIQGHHDYPNHIADILAKLRVGERHPEVLSQALIFMQGQLVQQALVFFEAALHSWIRHMGGKLAKRATNMEKAIAEGRRKKKRSASHLTEQGTCAGRKKDRARIRAQVSVRGVESLCPLAACQRNVPPAFWQGDEVPTTFTSAACLNKVWASTAKRALCFFVRCWQTLPELSISWQALIQVNFEDAGSPVSATSVRTAMIFGDGLTWVPFVRDQRKTTPATEVSVEADQYDLVSSYARASAKSPKPWTEALQKLAEMGFMQVITNIVTDVSAVMREVVLETNDFHYGATANALQLQGRWQLALDLIRSMASRDDSCLQVRASIITVTCAFGPWEASSRLLSMARQAVEKVDGPKPNVVSFTACIGSLEPESDATWDRGLSLMILMRRQRVRPNCVTVSAALGSIGGRWRLALSILSSVSQAGLRRDTVALNAAMGTTAVVLRRRLAEELCGSEEIVSSGQWLAANVLLWDLSSSALCADVVSFSSVVAACELKWRMAVAICEPMCLRKAQPNLITHRCLLRALENGGRWQSARDLLSSMTAQRISDKISQQHTAAACAKSGPLGSVLQQICGTSLAEDILTHLLMIRVA